MSAGKVRCMQVWNQTLLRATLTMVQAGCLAYCWPSFRLGVSSCGHKARHTVLLVPGWLERRFNS